MNKTGLIIIAAWYLHACAAPEPVAPARDAAQTDVRPTPGGLVGAGQTGEPEARQEPVGLVARPELEDRDALAVPSRARPLAESQAEAGHAVAAPIETYPEPAAQPGTPARHLAQEKIASGLSRLSVDALAPPPRPEHNREGYEYIAENGFASVSSSPLSTFGLDVDTASYSNVRRFLNAGQLPPPDAVRIEELINYFDYDYPPADARHPVRIQTELSVAPWNPAHRIALVGVRAKDLSAGEQVANRLVFLIDTSGSMNQSNKLPLLKRSLQILVEQMRAQDSVAIVTYAGSAGLVLPPTSGRDKDAIYGALARLRAGGSTAGARGIELAYQVAREQFLPQANNRVILATDGDFNVGQSSDGELVRLIEARRDSGIFLSVLGFGTGNYQDAKMQKLADHGNGTHHYIDSDQEADRVFRSQLLGTLYTVAKDVKIQIEWNPAKVAQYRLIGYENRLLATQDFRNDRKDAGDVGSGHTVTVLYEIIPVRGHDEPDALRYQPRRALRPLGRDHSGELGLVKLRYKLPQDSVSQEFSQVMHDQALEMHRASANLRWATAVAELGLLLGDSRFKGTASYAALIKRAQSVLDHGSSDPQQREFIGLARQARLASTAQLGFRN